MTGVRMRFEDLKHPLAASVDTISGHGSDVGYQLICHGINELKAEIEPAHFRALILSKYWHEFVDQWRGAARGKGNDAGLFQKLCGKMLDSQRLRDIEPAFDWPECHDPSNCDGCDESNAPSNIGEDDIPF